MVVAACCAARCEQPHDAAQHPPRTKRRRGRRPLGARLERRRLHQMGVARAFPQLEGRRYPGNREGGSHKVTGRGVLLTCGRHGGRTAGCGSLWARGGSFRSTKFPDQYLHNTHLEVSPHTVQEVVHRIGQQSFAEPVSVVLGARCVRAAALFYPWAPRSLGARRGPRPSTTPRGEAAWALRR